MVRKSEFDSLWKQGRRKPLTNWLQLVYRKNDLGHFRFGVSLSRKTGTAVVRNKMKRWTREILTEELKKELTKKPTEQLRSESQKLSSEIETKTGLEAIGGWDIHYIFRAPKAGFFKELTFSDYQQVVQKSLDFLRKASAEKASKSSVSGSRSNDRMDLSSSSIALSGRSMSV